ncbi:DUF1127 domain-containing protein [Primorskyibacter aestuariivivens]|uniref:DUF1127 domain-containing protein n=1 Tax=Primorskyibacter aestuariivivens TaxID=1888912 RepID=UPI002300392B|nr:DUF1127 domain-containing protein [Primorskyibacter aestuariivivens]MDA7429387.1 DUF1127 domain-containing protein [Primorskyibacter aestuariivivens]
MAQATTNIAFDSRNFFERLGDFLVKIGENSTRARRVELLSALSDEELAKIGLRREQIVRHVYSDVMCI